MYKPGESFSITAICYPYPLPHPVLFTVQTNTGKIHVRHLFRLEVRKIPSKTSSKYTDPNRHGGIGANCIAGNWSLSYCNRFWTTSNLRSGFSPCHDFLERNSLDFIVLLIVTWIIWEVFLFSHGTDAPVLLSFVRFLPSMLSNSSL